MVFVTAPDEACAVRLARQVVEEGLAACGNLVGGVRSIYRWQGEIHDEPESMVIFKTTVARFEALKQRILELHPYDCPEVLGVDVADGHADYLAWVAGMVEPKK
jgi:periplasmic divalent cation tolerance protein